MALPDCLQHVFYQDEIPPEVEQLFESIYQSPFSVLKHFAILREVPGPSALVISQGATPVHALAYLVSGHEITLLNELVDIEEAYLQRFAAALFDRYPAVSTINLNRQMNRISNSPYPCRLWQVSQDIAIDLPRSFDAYQVKLGKQTQKHLKYYLNRIKKEQGDFQFQVADSHQIDPAAIARILEMNRLRMESKNVRSGYDSLLEGKIGEFCRHYGWVGTLSIQGRIVAGAICYLVGNHTYLEAISHDPEFNRYNIGQVCLYLTIKEMIERGRDSFHMLWGEKEYKYRFLGVKHELFSQSIYRSSSAKLLSTPKLVRHGFGRVAVQADYLVKKYLLRGRR